MTRIILRIWMHFLFWRSIIGSDRTFRCNILVPIGRCAQMGDAPDPFGPAAPPAEGPLLGPHSGMPPPANAAPPVPVIQMSQAGVHRLLTDTARKAAEEVSREQPRARPEIPSAEKALRDGAKEVGKVTGGMYE